MNIRMRTAPTTETAIGHTSWTTPNHHDDPTGRHANTDDTRGNGRRTPPN